MPTSLGPAEILVILVVALIVLGPKRLPEAGRQIGRFVSEVRHWSSAVQAEIRDVIDTEGEPQPPPATSVPGPRPSAAAEWGLPQPAPAAPPAAPSGGIPAEWATPASSNGDGDSA